MDFSGGVLRKKSICGDALFIAHDVMWGLKLKLDLTERGVGEKVRVVQILIFKFYW